MTAWRQMSPFSVRLIASKSGRGVLSGQSCRGRSQDHGPRAARRGGSWWPGARREEGGGWPRGCGRVSFQALTEGPQTSQGVLVANDRAQQLGLRESTEARLGFGRPAEEPVPSAGAPSLRSELPFSDVFLGSAGAGRPPGSRASASRAVTPSAKGAPIPIPPERGG